MVKDLNQHVEDAHELKVNKFQKDLKASQDVIHGGRAQYKNIDELKRMVNVELVSTSPSRTSSET